MEIDPAEAGLQMILAYLLDWTFTDYDNRPLVIRDQPKEAVRAALDMLDAESYMEVQRAVQMHDTAISALVSEEKKILNSATPSGRT